MFAFVSGNLALDLAGTVQHRTTDRRDVLREPDDMARWMVEAGVLDTPCEVTPAGLEAAKELREALYRLASAAAEPHPHEPHPHESHLTGPRPAESQADREVVNRFAAAPPVGVRLDAAGRVERAGDLAAALSTVARQAVELLGGTQAVRIKECGAEACTRLYVDTSRGGARRWCDMQECGNRAKAAGFRARHRAL
ncbi:CGNR zinc finger domain-containing protein [Nonomuraea muscovyensis]|uniref:Putative RNA-binding Zn ribbon-like protein n=1 Tax=Nonomuraea muscovyensis TaxID=1124761 RepID=A0A7X0C5K4_9ACTN|nr:ABATE domain-containing protein [Nonomuraea muscovyensis]MBB6348787.1 putative RNA-binding Zn ribbon-like protein [Nonomuraea muscovyensis]